VDFVMAKICPQRVSPTVWQTIDRWTVGIERIEKKRGRELIEKICKVGCIGARIPNENKG
jgi:hypothetical protein